MKINLIPVISLLLVASCTQSGGTEESLPKPKSEMATTTTQNNINVSDWMSWEGGIDVAGVTDKSLKMPNVIFHVAHMVNTPVGNAPSGMIFYQPDSTKPPMVVGFVSTDTTIGKYFGPKIFAGTPFEKAPVLKSTFDIKYDDKTATAKVVAGGHTFECTMTDLGKPYLLNRAAGNPMPFNQQGIERAAGKTTLKIDGKEIVMTIPPIGLAGGPGAVLSVNGVYAR